MKDLSHKKILVIYTGGTIGMVSTEQGYDIQEGYLTGAVKNLITSANFNMPEFVIKEYTNLIDSSNIKPKSWFSIASDIIENYEQYDGFVVLHGTDTLAYTASVLSFMLGEIQKPVIVTGSQIPLSKVRSDGVSNIMNSLIFACSDYITEVCVYFNQKLRRGNRTTKVSATDFDAFISPNYPSLAYVGIDLDLKKERLWSRKKAKQLPKIEALSVPKVAILTIFPEMDSDIFDVVLKPSLQGLILKTYGAGNIPNDPNILESLAKASDRGVVIVNCTQCLYGTVKMGAYKAGSGLAKAGVVSGHDMTDEAAFGKLFYLLSQPNISPQKVKDAFKISLQGEVSL
ncbi:asparaginase [Francisella sp. Scap27]|uniref:asparaginase n=1 Tax=Francisella sp. Scap27 TaxID=2589986 RepID=UPI0015B96B33|nr:asparaginase [Francisella sp. Scap27]QLE79728.1 asparaginase [Francisella sp. Scap27]